MSCFQHKLPIFYCVVWFDLVLLQYYFWDHFKELDNMDLSRSMNLAKLVAEMLSNFTLSLATLKVVNLANPVEMTPERIAHFRMMLETLLQKK
jgi:nucleolar MIF4G domain-containing protein 1